MIVTPVSCGPAAPGLSFHASGLRFLSQKICARTSPGMWCVFTRVLRPVFSLSSSTVSYTS